MSTTSHASRLKIKISLLNDSNRIREDYSHVADLAKSIRERGLIQPIVCTADYTVIDGGSRLRACRDVLNWTEIDVVFMENMSEGELRILEVEANVRRKDFTWQERILAVVRVHELKAASAALAGEKWGQRQTGELLGVALGNVNNALTLAGLIRLRDKEILAATGPVDALKIILKRKEAEATKLLATATFNGANITTRATSAMPVAAEDVEFFGAQSTPAAISVAPTDFDEVPGGASSVSTPAQPTETITIPLSQMLLRGDCIQHMGAMPENYVDHIITDIPYGIDMDYLNQDNKGIKDISDVENEHTVEGNLFLMQQLFPAAFRVLKPQGFFIFWYDLSHHEKLYNWGTSAGFRVQRWPLVWHKTHTCLNQFAGKNFTKNYEVAMVCSKGNSSLVTAQGSSVWAGSNEDVKTILQHPFAKPFKLWKWVMNAVAIRGQTVYDPFAGVGSSTIAAIDEGLKPICSELNDEHYNRLVVNIANLYKTRLGNVTFQ